MTAAHRRRTQGLAACLIDPRAARGRSLWPDRRPDHQLRPLPDPRPTDRGPERRSLPARAPTRPPATPRAARRRHPTPATPRTPARSSGSARPTPTTVVFELCRPDVAFLSKIASPAFAINDAGWLASHIDPAATGPQAIVDQVNGTGPYRLESWTHGSEVSLARNDGYWGDKAANERFIARWYDNAGAAHRRAPECERRWRRRHRSDRGPGGDRRYRPEARATARSRRLLRRLHRHLRTVRQRARPPGDRHRHRPPAHRRRLLPAGFRRSPRTTRRARSPTGAAATPGTSTTRPLAKEMLASAGFPDGFDTKIQYTRHADRRTCPTRPASRPSSRTSSSPTSGSEPSSRSSRTTPSSPTLERGQARRHPSARPERDLPRRRRVPRGALRGRRVDRSSGRPRPTSARRSPRAGRPRRTASATPPMPRSTTRSAATSP